MVLSAPTGSSGTSKSAAVKRFVFSRDQETFSCIPSGPSSIVGLQGCPTYYAGLQ